MHFQCLVDYAFQYWKPLISDYHATNGGSGTKGSANILFICICFVIAKHSSRPNISRVLFACRIFEGWVDLFFLEKFSLAQYKIFSPIIGAYSGCSISLKKI